MPKTKEQLADYMQTNPDWEKASQRFLHLGWVLTAFSDHLGSDRQTAKRLGEHFQKLGTFDVYTTHNHDSLETIQKFAQNGGFMDFLSRKGNREKSNYDVLVEELQKAQRTNARVKSVELFNKDLETLEEVLDEPANYASPDSQNKWKALKQELPKEEEEPAPEDAKRISLYDGTVTVVENSTEHLVDVVRNEIVDHPDFKKEPPKVAPEQLALLGMLNAGLDYGIHKPHNPMQLQQLKEMVHEEMKVNGSYYRRMAQFPEIHKALAQREPGASWFKSGSEAYLKATDQFEAHYQPNGKDAQTLNAALLRDGHGGKLMENIRKSFNRTIINDEIQDILNENTVIARAGKLRTEAGKLSQQLLSDDAAVREQALLSSRQVFSEYTYLSDGCMKGNQFKDVSWKTAQATATSSNKDMASRQTAPMIDALSMRPAGARKRSSVRTASSAAASV